MEKTGIEKKIASIINGYISPGLIPDTETVSFINSAYGITDPDDIASLIGSGDDGGAVIDLLSHPSDELRESVEKIIPPQGLSSAEIQNVEDTLSTSSGQIFILFNKRKIFLPEEDSLYCHKRILQRLNLHIPLNRITVTDTSECAISTFAVRALLRKKKFESNDESILFINDLIYNYFPVKNKIETETLTAGVHDEQQPDGSFKIPEDSCSADLFTLIDITTDLLKSSVSKPYDILSEKKYFYENAITESEEFSALLKTYSMEFVMMKKIQPPLMSIHEARSMVTAIDRLTFIVYRTIIPSVLNIFIDS